MPSLPQGSVEPFAGRLVMLGFGCIGQAVLPLLLRHLALAPRQLVAISAGTEGEAVARESGIALLHERVTTHNLHAVLGQHLSRGDFLLNLSVDVSSVALIQLCREHGALYLDTCIEPWAGGYVDATLAPAQRTNHALREAALEQRAPGTPTALLTHGANPGLVSHFVKQALLELAGMAEPPTGPLGWPRLAQQLGLRTIQISECDTQVARQRKKPGEFVNTWSVPGFISEALQPAELGWGTHERHFPADGGRHEAGSRASIYLHRPGAATMVRTWTPLAGPLQAFLITHGEAISIADHLTLADGVRPVYRPTVFYAYRPCDEALLSLYELSGRQWQPQEKQRLLVDDIEPGGIDELGVLLMGHAGGADWAYWYGSQLGVDEARTLAPHNSATSLQVAAGVMAGVVWSLRHPQRGIVEPDELPHAELLALARPYLGRMVGVKTDWTPLAGRGTLFAERLDTADPWQFLNFRVA